MSHIDTLKTYQDYLAAGYTEKQALTAVQSLEKSFDGVVTKEYLHSELALFKSEMRSDLFFTILLPMIIGFGIQIVLKRKGLV